MSKYIILPYSYKKAKELGVDIKVSTNSKKKIDVFKDGKKICSIGGTGYNDYPHFLKVDKELAQERRALYKIRHHKDISKVGSPGWYADKILW
jgi:hypothetical protein